jgi:lysophospholipase L1-like esterase
MIRETHPIYTDAVKEVAQKAKVPLIDLDEKSKALLQMYGPETSKYLFNYLDPNEHPNYPDGRKDDTHFSELGARKIAEIVLAEIKQLHLELADRIVNTNK